MKRVGIYSGSFNPVHRGHLALAQYLVDGGYVDEVWMIRSPRNPLKSQDGLLDDGERLAMLRLAVRGRKGLHVSTVEDALPTPNYTVVTLRTLAGQHPDCEFHLIIGADNWDIFDRWRAYDEILRDYHLIVYPRPGSDKPVVDAARYPNVIVAAEAPQHDISSTQIRAAIASGADISHLVPDAVARYISSHQLYLSENFSTCH